MKSKIIAEIGSNWEGNLTKAKKLIVECKNSGADAVKFQMWKPHDLYSKNHPEWDFIKKSEVTFDVAQKLKKFSDDLGIEFFVSVFYHEAIDFLESIGVKRYKVASRTCLFHDPYSLEILKKEAETRKPIIISMGMGGNKKRIKKIFSKNKTIFCYCISEYPLDIKKINWVSALNYDGFSDHTLGITAPLIFATLKKFQETREIIIEKHVKLKNSKGPDASSSITTEELKELVNHVRVIQKLKI